MNKSVKLKKICKKNIEDIFALTPIQEGILFHYLKEPESDLYFEQLSLGISAKIDNRIFEQAWNFIIETNEMLRTVFRWEHVKRPIQVVLKEYRLKPIYYDFLKNDSNKKEELLKEIKAEDRKKKFDLWNVPFRVTLCKVEDDKYELVISNHHILYDGWSTGIILKEFIDSYKNLFNKKAAVKPNKTKFKDFIKWTQKQDIKKQEEFWKEYLKGFDIESGISLERRKREIKSTGKYHIKFPGEIKDRLEGFIKKRDITIASLLYSIWGILLQQYNRSSDVIFYTTVSGRSARVKGIENIVGLFINTLPFRIKTHPGEKVSDFISRMNNMLQKRRTFENSSPVSVNRYLYECRKKNLFDSVVVIENYPLNRILMQENSLLSINSFSLSGMTQYDLTVIVTIFDSIEVNFTYNKDLFSEESVVGLSNHLICILQEILSNPGKKVSEIAGVSEEERKRLRCALNNIAGESPESKYYAAPTNKTEVELVKIWSEVLGIEKEQLGIYDNFFDLGGHSLTAAMLVSKLHKAFNMKLPLMELFETPFIKGLARNINRYVKGAASDKYTAIEPVEKREYYSLSSAQKRLYVSQQMDLNNTCYNTLQVFILGEDISKRKLEVIFRQLILRHESLRTSFQMIDDEPFQKVHEDVEFSITCYDCDSPGRGEEAEVKERNTIDRVEDNDTVEEGSGGAFIDLSGSSQQQITGILKYFVRPFDLSTAPLLRVGLMKTGNGEHTMLVDMHHIISDDVTYDILVKDFSALSAGEQPQDLKIQYKDFSGWQNKLFESGELKSQEEYWLGQFADEIPVLDLPTDYQRPAAPSYDGERLYFKFDRVLSNKLIKMAKETGTTLYILLLAAYNILLAMYSRQEYIAIGATVSGRRHEDLYNVTGMFVNMIVIRNHIVGSKRFKDFLEEVKQNTLDAFENQDYQFEKLVSKLDIARDTNKNPLFNVAFLIRNSENREKDNNTLKYIKNLKISSYKYEKKSSEFDMLFLVEVIDDDVSLIMEYSTVLFKRMTAKKIIERYVDVLKQIVGDRNIKIGDFKIFLNLLPVKSNINEQDLSEFEF